MFNKKKLFMRKVSSRNILMACWAESVLSGWQEYSSICLSSLCLYAAKDYLAWFNCSLCIMTVMSARLFFAVLQLQEKEAEMRHASCAETVERQWHQVDLYITQPQTYLFQSLFVEHDVSYLHRKSCGAQGIQFETSLHNWTCWGVCKIPGRWDGQPGWQS